MPTQKALKEKAIKIITKLKELFPDPKIALNYSNNVELLFAVMMSAQCTDRMVNIVTAKLFKKYKTLHDYVTADITEFEQDIKSTGFYHSKAKHILETAKILETKYNGKVPDCMQDLLTLSGVGRKTANVVMGNAYGKTVGIVVDTHVRRLTKLLGLTTHNDPIKIEQDLMKIIPREDWFILSHLLIAYGRTYCSARKHNHATCPLSSL